MSILKDILKKPVSLGDLQRVHSLGVIPIFINEIPELPELETLESVSGRGLARITETSPAGEVPFLKLENAGEKPIIILDGEEVVGGKQNRIINTTLVILAHTRVKVPVSCVQAGRWRQERADFQSAGAVFRARSRAAQMASVTASVRDSGSFQSDQRAVWDEVSETLGELGVRSSTSDFGEGRERVANRLEEFVEAIQPAENQIGAVFINALGILGLEMLATPVLFSKVCDKVTQSFAFEVLNAPDLNGTSIETATQWWDRILEAGFTKHDSPGAGVDIRLGTKELIGSGLIWDGVVVHFSCFPNMRRHSQRRASTSQRRRHLQ